MLIYSTDLIVNMFRSLGYSALEEVMLKDAHAAVTKAGMWVWLQMFQPEKDLGFALSTTPELMSIDKFMSYKHDSQSYEWTMTQVSLLAQYGVQGLAKLRGVDLDWNAFLAQFEGRPEWKDQWTALKQFEQGKLSYAQMRNLCG